MKFSLIAKDSFVNIEVFYQYMNVLDIFGNSTFFFKFLLVMLFLLTFFSHKCFPTWLFIPLVQVSIISKAFLRSIKQSPKKKKKNKVLETKMDKHLW